MLGGIDLEESGLLKPDARSIARLPADAGMNV